MSKPLFRTEEGEEEPGDETMGYKIDNRKYSICSSNDSMRIHVGPGSTVRASRESFTSP